MLRTFVAAPLVVKEVCLLKVPPLLMKVTTVPSGTTAPDESLTVALRAIVPGQTASVFGVAASVMLTGTPVGIGVLVRVGVIVGVTVGVKVWVGVKV